MDAERSEGTKIGANFSRQTVDTDRGSGAGASERSSSRVAREDIRIELEPEPGLLRNDQHTVFDLRRFLVEPERARHVFDGQPVRHGGDEMNVDLRHEMAHYRQIE